MWLVSFHIISRLYPKFPFVGIWELFAVDSVGFFPTILSDTGQPLIQLIVQMQIKMYLVDITITERANLFRSIQNDAQKKLYLPSFWFSLNILASFAFSLACICLSSL